MTPRPGRSEAELADALAAAFLSGDWQAPAMARRAGALLGRRRAWITALARQLCEQYREQPSDRPRELAAVIRGCEPFRRGVRAASRGGERLHPRGRPVAAVRMAGPRFPVPVLDDLAALAALLRVDPDRLDWYADVRGMQRRAPEGPLQLYRYRWIERPGRLPRLLEVPVAPLREVQRTLLREVVGRIPAHPAAHGFVPGRGAATGAAVHAGAATVVCVDLTAFFTRVRAGQIYGTLRTAGYPEPVAHVLTGLTTTATPTAALARMPPGGEPEERFRLRRWLATAHLPQGAPTSPQLANLACQRMDRRLAGYAQATGLRYTRYADDLAFSGDLGRRTAPLLRAVAGIAEQEGFTLNPAKTRVRTRAERQLVTGLVVNERVTVTRSDYDALRAVLHNCARHGPQTQNRSRHPDFRAHLLGRIAWVSGVDRRRGARLRAEFDRIAWPSPAADQPPSK